MKKFSLEALKDFSNDNLLDDQDEADEKDQGVNKSSVKKPKSIKSIDFDDVANKINLYFESSQFTESAFQLKKFLLEELKKLRKNKIIFRPYIEALRSHAYYINKVKS